MPFPLSFTLISKWSFTFLVEILIVDSESEYLNAFSIKLFKILSRAFLSAKTIFPLEQEHLIDIFFLLPRFLREFIALSICSFMRSSSILNFSSP